MPVRVVDASALGALASYLWLLLCLDADGLVTLDRELQRAI